MALTTRGRTSKVWTYFIDEGSGRAKCNVCRKSISFKGGATFNLTRHLRVIHPSVMFSSKKTLPADNLIRYNVEKHQAAVTPSDISRENETLVSSFTDASTERQTALSSFVKKPLSDKRNQEINFSLVEAIVKNYLPFQLAESIHFKKFVAKLNNSYCLPNQKVISNILMPQLYNMTKEKVRSSLASATSCCITTDCWTTLANESFLSVTVHYINQNTELKSNFLDCVCLKESHSAENLAAEMKRIALEWEIDAKIVAVVSDNTASIIAAIRLAGWEHIPCFAHNMNLIVQYGLNEIKDLQVKVKRIVEFFKRSPQASEKLKNMQIQLDVPVLHVKQDDVTRWTSTYDMFARILEVKDALISTIAINFSNVDNITNYEIILISNYCEILKVFKDLTEELSSEKVVTASKVILLSQALKNWCKKYITREDITDQARNFCEKLLEGLDKRFRSVEENNIFSEATFLDPRFKRYGFSQESCFKKAKQMIISEVHSMEHFKALEPTEVMVIKEESAELGIWTEFDSTVSNLVQHSDSTTGGITEVNKYLEEPLLSRSSSPLVWWRERQSVYPRLFKVAHKRLCIVGTSVPSEFIFSKAGQLSTERRNRLSGGKVSQILFLNTNL